MFIVSETIERAAEQNEKEKKDDSAASK